MTALTLDALVEAGARGLYDDAYDALLLGTLQWEDVEPEERELWSRRARAALAALHRAAVSTEIAHDRTRALIGAAEVVMEESAGRQQDRSGIGLEYAYALRDVSDFLRALAEAADHD